eukprot:COSAG02_NODE_197_length_29578_cov_9.718647_6_plen_64_part_00
MLKNRLADPQLPLLTARRKTPITLTGAAREGLSVHPCANTGKNTEETGETDIPLLSLRSDPFL